MTDAGRLPNPRTPPENSAAVVSRARASTAARVCPPCPTGKPLPYPHAASAAAVSLQVPRGAARPLPPSSPGRVCTGTCAPPCPLLGLHGNGLPRPSTPRGRTGAADHGHGRTGTWLPRPRRPPSTGSGFSRERGGKERQMRVGGLLNAARARHLRP